MGLFIFTTKLEAAVWVNLASPNGGEDWTGNTSHNIRWEVQGGTTPYQVDLSYSDNGGLTCLPSFITGMDQDGTNREYSWQLPSITGSEIKVKEKVTDKNGKNAKDISDNNFKIDSTTPSITDYIPARDAVSISITESFKITFSEEMDKTTTQSAISLNPAVTNLKFSWQGNKLKISHDLLQYNTEYTCKIITTAKDISDPGNTLSEIYEWKFKTASFGIKVTSPNGKKNWTGNTVHPINWEIIGGKPPYSVSLFYFIGDNTPVAIVIVTQPQPGQFSSSWTIPTFDSDKVRVKIAVIDNISQSATDLSDESFKIDSTKPTIVKVSPEPNKEEVEIIEELSIEFSKEMNKASVEADLSLTLELKDLKYKWEGNKIIIEHPDFSYVTSYLCKISEKATDISLPGNAITLYQWSFTTLTGKVGGKIIDIKNRRPIKEAKIIVKTNDTVVKETKTNEKGEFNLGDLPQGKYKIEIIATGYFKIVTEEKEVSGQANEINFGEVALIPIVTSEEKVCAYPNPAKNKVTFSYEIAKAPAEVVIKIYNLASRLVTKITDKAETIGKKETVWNFAKVAPGVYIYIISIGEENLPAKKLAVIR